MITNQTEHCVDRNRTNEEPDKTLIVRFSINSYLVLFSLLFSYRLLCCFRFSVYLFIFFNIFACFLEGRLKKNKTRPNKTEKKNGSISVSGQRPTYPSPNPTFTLSYYQLTVVGLWEGQVGRCPDTDIDPKKFLNRWQEKDDTYNIRTNTLKKKEGKTSKHRT